MKHVLGLFVFVMLAAALFANTIIPAQNAKETQVVIQPADETGKLVKISVLAFEPAASAVGTTSGDKVKEWYTACQGSADGVMACMQKAAAAENANLRDYQFTFTSIKDAQIVVEYFNPQGDQYRGQWSTVLPCSNLQASAEGVANIPSKDAQGAMTPYTYYYAQCDLSSVVTRTSGDGSATTYLRARYVPKPADPYAASEATYDYTGASVTFNEQFNQMINDIITGMSQGGGGVLGVGGLPCMGVFMILGLLLASLYFTGKSPVTLLDITTPKLPTPKGVAASGQVLAPFGYTEMKRTTTDKMKAAATALSKTRDELMKGLGGRTDVSGAMAGLYAQKGDSADRLAKTSGRTEGLAVSSAFIAGAAATGRKGADLQKLAKLPYHWGDAEHKEAAAIIAALEAMGGRHALMAMTLKDYLFSMRTFQSLEVLTGHGGVGARSAMHYRLSNFMGKMYGANRYNSLSSVVMAGTDSAIRSTRMLGRMSKAMVTEMPHLARATTKTTMQMIGGKSAIAALEARGKTSPTAAWLAKEVQKHPSQVIIGSMFPITEKMAHLYKSLRDEAVRDEMRYVLRQLYKKYGVKFDISEQEMVNMGHLDVDILKRSNLKASAELAKAEAEIRKILTNTNMGVQERLSALTALAESHGAQIDHQMLAFSQRLQAIEASPHGEDRKMVSLQQLLEEQSSIKMAVKSGGKVSDDAFICHVGGDSLRHTQIWETMVLRTMIWDAENGFLRGGLEHELKSARLNTANRMTTLDPSSAPEMLPEHMRDMAQLKKVAARNREDLISLFSDEGRKAYEKYANGKAIQSASISEIVKFMYGGELTRTGKIDKETGKMVWRGSDLELGLNNRYTMVDVKRHWLSELNSRDNIAIAHWTEARFTKSYVPAFKASIEAELNRTPGSANWTIEQRTAAAKKLWISDQLVQDMEQRFNSQFGHNTYGTTRETSRFYAGIMAGFLGKAMDDKGLESNHPDRMFLDHMDLSNAKHLSKLNELLETHNEAYRKVISKGMTYDDIAGAKRAVIKTNEGGMCYYHKGMMLSDMDRVMAGQAAMKDKNGIFRPFIPEDVRIQFHGNNILEEQYRKITSSKDSKDPKQWGDFLESAKNWSKNDDEKKKVFAAVLWNYSTTTFDYSHFWKESGVSIEAKRQVAPVAPSALRQFGYEGTKASDYIKPFRDIAMHGGDYISKVALLAGGELHRTSFDITPLSSTMRAHSLRLADKIRSGEALKGMTEEERVAYRAVANQQGAFHQVWDYAIDRNPWLASSSFGTHQAWASYFQFGPAATFKVKDNLRAYMGKAEYASFMASSGFAMDFAGKVMKPYINMMRGMQMSMQGYASSKDSTQDSLRQYNYTEPRVREAMQSLNPFSARWSSGKTGDRIAKLNMMGGSLEAHQLAGPDYQAGLSVAPSDIYLNRKGIYSPARIGEANPQERAYSYRMELLPDAAMAEYAMRSKEAALIYDKEIQKASMDNTVRRTVSAEALAIRRDQELRGFGMMANPLWGWANPLMFAWHAPVPFMPSWLTPKEQVAKWKTRSIQGGGGSFGDSIQHLGERLGRGVSNAMQPHKISMVVYCPKCGMSNYRGSHCKNPSCKQAQY
ncbi:MAG: hypothetical protein V1827_03325 [Candidatus Micrarchaeota archaeon]